MSDFDVIISSHQIGVCKPDKKIFQTLVDAAGVKPEELIYSDDNPSRIDGAAQLGIQTFVYKNFEQFLEELKSRGVGL